MKHILVILLLSVSFRTALASDFRTVDFGETCYVVPGKEKILGSLRNEGSGAEHQEYRGLYLDREAKIIYDCSDNGRFRRGTYIYDFNNIDEASSFFNIAKQLLISKLGEPTLDATLQEHSSAMAEIGFKKEDGYMVRWQLNGVIVMLSALRPSSHSEYAAVSIDFTRNGD